MFNTRCVCMCNGQMSVLFSILNSLLYINNYTFLQKNCWLVFLLSAATKHNNVKVYRY